MILATEFKLSYTGSQINEKLNKIDNLMERSEAETIINTALAQAKESGEFDGKNGVSATHSWNGTTLTVTSASGTSSANLKGDAGASPTIIIEETASGVLIEATNPDGTQQIGYALHGAPGKSPVKGVDYWTETDKNEIIQSVVAELGVVIGEVDSQNNILITVPLSDGTYTMRYENADGSVTDIGTFTVNNGGGEVEPTYTNQIKISTDTDGSVYNGTGFKSGVYISSSDGTIGTRDGISTTGFIPIKRGDVVRMQNVGFIIKASNASNLRFATYNSSKQFLKFVNASNTYTFIESNVGITNSNNELVEFTIKGDNALFVTDAAYMRICTDRIFDDSIITINEPIE